MLEVLAKLKEAPRVFARPKEGYSGNWQVFIQLVLGEQVFTRGDMQVWMVFK